MYLKLQRDKNGLPLEVKNQQTKSSYLPGDKSRGRIAQIQKDYLHGKTIQSKTYREFNDRTLIEEININQQAFNSYVPPRSENPDDAWRAQTVRPITRNKLISIAAHVTSAILYPRAFAVDDCDEEDRNAGNTMGDLMEWAIDNTNYKRSFIQAVISALVDPAVFLEAGFYRIMRQVKEKTDQLDENGDATYTKKEVIDEVLSGFRAYVIPCQHILISNIYEPDIQKQRFIIKDRYIDYYEAKQIYGMHRDFKYVMAGEITVFDDYSKTFYGVQDPESKNYLVKETVYYNRFEDLELVCVNGILVTNPDQPISRQDKLYPIAKTGYEPLNNGQFFYYKSAANKLGSDQEIIDTLYNLIIDGSFMALMPPMAAFGSEEADSSVMIPGTMTSFRDPNVKFENLAPKTDLRGGMETISLVERSLAESSQDNLRAGVGSSGGATAREVMLLDKNAQIALGLFKHMIGFLVEDFGTLLIGDILQHFTVPSFSDSGEAKYKNFNLPDKVIEGQKVTKKVQFTDEYADKETMTADDVLEESWKLFDKEGGPKADIKISKVNAPIFRARKFKTKVGVDELAPKSKALEKALNLEAYDRLITNPFVDQELVTRDFLLDMYKPGEGDKYIKKQMPMQMPGMEGEGEMQKPNAGVNTGMLSQITGSNSLGVAASTE
jgi:hypothetical protein